MTKILIPIRNKQNQIEFRYVAHRIRNRQSGTVLWASCFKPISPAKPQPMRLPRYLEIEQDKDRALERRDKPAASKTVKAATVKFSQPCPPPKDIPTPV